MTYADILRRGKSRHGEKFDASNLDTVDPAVRNIVATHARARVILETTYPSGATFRRSGRIGVTTGYRPSFLLMSRIDSTGSSDIIGPAVAESGTTTKVVAVQHGRRYRSLATGEYVKAPSLAGDYTEPMEATA